MKAILVPTPGGPEALVYGEAPDPEPGSGEVMVRVKATAVNRADLMQAAGLYPPPEGESEILGLEAAGEVEATGERVFFLLAGGGYAERVAVPLGLLMPIPPSLSFEEAAAIPEAWLTAYLNLFTEGGLSGGRTVMIHAAASGVGTAAVQLARARSAGVIATTRSDRKTETLRNLGANLVVDLSKEDLVARVEEDLGKESVHLILDPVGGSLLDANLRLLARKGTLILIATMGGATAQIDLRKVLAKRLRIMGSTLRSRPLDEKVHLTSNFSREILPGFASGKYRPIVDTVMPLSKAAEAHTRMAANENVGKLVLTVGD